MKRIIVIGSPGAGKSTFARQLRDIAGLPLYQGSILKRIRFKFRIDYDAEAGGRVLLNEMYVEVVSLLQRVSNTRAKTITLEVEMEDYHRIMNGGE